MTFKKLQFPAYLTCRVLLCNGSPSTAAPCTILPATWFRAAASTCSCTNIERRVQVSLYCTVPARDQLLPPTPGGLITYHPSSAPELYRRQPVTRSFRACDRERYCKRFAPCGWLVRAEPQIGGPGNDNAGAVTDTTCADAIFLGPVLTCMS